MGINGDTTISALQDATGILSSSLPDFAPSSHDPANGVYVSDFLINQIGRRDTVNGYQTDLDKVTNEDLQKGDTFEVFLSVEKPNLSSNVNAAQFWVEQILDGGNNFVDDGSSNVAFQGYTVDTDATGYQTLKLAFEVTGLSSVQVRRKLTGTLNNDAANHGATLVYNSLNDSDTDVRGTQPAIDRLEWDSGGNTGSDEMRFDAYLYDPADKINDFIEWDVAVTGVDKSENVDHSSLEKIASFYWQYPSGSEGNPENITVRLRDGSGGTIEQEDTVTFTVDSTDATALTKWG